jgi:hypothetical protein
MGNAFLMNQSSNPTSEGITELIGSLSYSGTYANSTYYRVADCRMGFNTSGEVFITIRGGTSTSYENVYFTLVSIPIGSGITLVGQGSYRYASETAGQYYTAILAGVTQKINVAINFSTRNGTYDWVRADMTVTYV